MSHAPPAVTSDLRSAPQWWWMRSWRRRRRTRWITGTWWVLPRGRRLSQEHRLLPGQRAANTHLQIDGTVWALLNVQVIATEEAAESWAQLESIGESLAVIAGTALTLL